MYSGNEMDFAEQDAAFFEELGFGDDFMFQNSEFNISGEDLMLSSAMTLSDLEPNSVVEPHTANGEPPQLTELRPMNFGYGDTFESAFGLNDVPLDVGNEVTVGIQMQDVKFAVDSEISGTSKMEDVKFAVDSETPGTSDMKDVKFAVDSETPETSDMKDVKFAVDSENPETSKMEKVKFTVDSQTPGTSKTANKKPALANRSTKGVAVKVGVKGRGRGSRNSVKDEVAEVLRLRPPRKLKHRVAQHVPEEKKDAEYYEHRRKNTEAARKCREKKRGVDEKRVEIIEKQDKRIKELEAMNESLQHDNKIYKKVIDQLGQSEAVKGLRLTQDHRRPKKTRKSHRRDRK